jgi:hypothetical protein
VDIAHDTVVVDEEIDRFSGLDKRSRGKDNLSAVTRKFKRGFVSNAGVSTCDYDAVALL